MSEPTSQRVVLVRHGETEWSTIGRHTGRRDIPLTEAGRVQAAALAPVLREWNFAAVFCSTLQRARVTADLAGVGHNAQYDPDLQEWDYGSYDGRTLDEIREEQPGWTIWTAQVTGGESVDDVGNRADRVIARVQAVKGDVCLVAHGHFLRILSARWMGMPPVEGAHFALSTAALSILGSERDIPAIMRWNDQHHLQGQPQPAAR